MTIYQIPNGLTYLNDYVSDSQADVTANTGNTQINSIVLGDITTANNILIENQSAYLSNQSFRLNANKQVVTGTATVITGVDYLTEPANTDQIYNIFNDLTGTYTQVVGTAALSSTIASYQTQLLSAAGLTSSDMVVVTTIPQPKKVAPATTGTQTL